MREGIVITNARFDRLTERELLMLVAFAGQSVSRPPQFFFWLWTHANEELTRRARIAAGETLPPVPTTIDPNEYTSYEVIILAETASLAAQVLACQCLPLAADVITQASVSLIAIKLVAQAQERGEAIPRGRLPWKITEEGEAINAG